MVLYLLTMPAAVFLTVGYTESLYLALAIPAWRAAAGAGGTAPHCWRGWQGSCDRMASS